MKQTTILSLITFVINMTLLTFVGTLDQSTAFSSSKPTARTLFSMTSTNLEASNSYHQDNNRRTFLKQYGALVVGAGVESLLPQDVMAKPDCISDCLKNCKLIAPKVRYKR